MSRKFFLSAVVVVMALSEYVSADSRIHICQSLFANPASDPWVTLMEPAKNIFTSNVNDLKFRTRREVYRIYESPDTSHARILKDVFKVPFDSSQPMPTVKQMIDRYEDYMEGLVHKKIITKDDVLIPVFVFFKGSKMYILQYGDPIPEGARMQNDLLSPAVFKTVVAQGFFPVGNETVTNTGISAFEHDLAHFTGFIENPQYMIAIRKHAQRESSVREPYFDTFNRAKREYFLSESLVIVKPETKSEMINLLILNPKMKENLNRVSYAEILHHLKKVDPKQMIHIANQLAYRYERYFTNLGGGSRDPLSSADSRIHTPIRAFIDEARNLNKPPLQTLLAFAKLQFILIRFSEISLEDWFRAAEGLPGEVPAIRKLFEEKAVWQNHSDLYRLF